MGAISQKGAEFLIRSRLADAERGDVDALFELGVTYSTGRGGVPVDLIEAHKWFNLAALSGCTRGQQCRAEIAIEMTAREIAEAQRQARAWLGASATSAAPPNASDAPAVERQRRSAALGPLLAPADDRQLRRRHPCKHQEIAHRLGPPLADRQRIVARRRRRHGPRSAPARRMARSQRACAVSVACAGGVELALSPAK